VSIGHAWRITEAVRRGLQVLLDQARRRRLADKIIRGYEAIPQSLEEWGWADEATVRVIGDEPW